MIWGWIGLAAGALMGVLGWYYDRRSPAEKDAADRRKLGHAIGVPTLFDRHD